MMLPGRSISSRCLKEAREHARPHWDEAEETAARASVIRREIAGIRGKIKELEKSKNEYARELRKREKVVKRLEIENGRLEALSKELATAEQKHRDAKRTGDSIYDAVFNLDFKNPHADVDNHGDPGELLQKLEAAEKETASLRDQLKAILEKALLR